ncbi:MAG: hypothetical protein V7731_02745 [Amphritea sp.]
MSATFFKSIRAKLIGIFILIKAILLIALEFFAWQAATQLGINVTLRSTEMADGMLETIQTVGVRLDRDA